MDDLRSRSSSDTILATPPGVTCRTVQTDLELREHLRIRRQVFVLEQGLFTDDDRDEHDDDPATIHVLGLVGASPSGTVRLFPFGTPDEPRLWKGDRLAVCSEHRHAGLGGPLVELAVSLAGAAGGSRMVAWVQLPNVRFFRHLGWEAIGAPESYVGELHQQMSIGLQ